MDPLHTLHPDCPDWRRLGPTAADAAVRARAAAVTDDRQSRDKAWSKGFTRRRLLQGGLGVGVAALAGQLVTTRVAYAAPGTDTGTLVVVFLRGGLDGLSVLVPGDDPHLLAARPDLAVRASTLLPFANGFGLHPALAPLDPLLKAGLLAAVPAISTPDLSRSHFQAQDCLERGGASSGSGGGWLDRVLEQSGPGTTFRGIGVGDRLPRALLGTSGSLALDSMSSMQLNVPDEKRPATRAALEQLYTGLDHPLSEQVRRALDATDQLGAVVSAGLRPSTERGYPDSGFGRDLSVIADLITSGTGVRVANVDVGGWDMHTEQTEDMNHLLGGVAQGLAAFHADLGDKASRTTVVVMSEFGRRISQNASMGTDHGHGGLALVLGGGVRAGVHGSWTGLDPATLDGTGDVPGSNDFRDLLGEVVMKRLDLSAGAAATVFDGRSITPLGVMA